MLQETVKAATTKRKTARFVSRKIKTNKKHHILLQAARGVSNILLN
jgi:hypothetical protein